MMAHSAWHDRICSDPELHHGERCVRGTRISVSVIVATLADMTMEELLAQFPQPTRDDVRAALLLARGASMAYWRT